MNTPIEPLIFITPLGLNAHAQAEEFRQYHYLPDKAKQVYLNTLAVYAVNIYLQYREFETDWEESDSYDPLMQGLMNVADLVVSKYGKLECRPVLPTASVMEIPEEVWTERIGYVAVQFNDSLRQANLLGFVATATTKELPLSHLRSIEELPTYISQFKSKNVPAPVHLSLWLQNIFDIGWETVQTLLNSPESTLDFSFRQLPSEVKRGKLLKLTQASQKLGLFVGLTPTATSELDISVEVYPLVNQTSLPGDLEVMILDQTEKPVIQASPCGSSSLEFRFSGEPGETFSVKVSLGTMSITETFLI